MSRAILVAGLMAASAAAQANFATDGFQYVGCVQASKGVFPVKMELGDSFTVAQCQEACGKTGAYAAAAGNGCHCNNPISQAAVDFDVKDDAKCSKACKEGDDKAGQCGGPISTEGQQLYNLYQRIATDPVPSMGPGASLPPIANKAVDIDMPTSTYLMTVTTCPPGVVDCPDHMKSERPHTTPCTKEHPPPPPPPVETKVALPEPCSESKPPPPPPTTPCGCEDPIKPTHKPKPCPGPDCMQSSMMPKPKPCPGPDCMQTSMRPHPPPPPPTSDVAPAVTDPVIVSEGSSRPASAVMAILSIGALVLAMGMS